MLRIPGWCSGETLRVNGQRIDTGTRVRGYVRIARTWKSGDVVELDMPMPVRQVRANPMVQADAGRVGLMRGPLIYCVESADNNDHVRTMSIPVRANFSTEFREELPGGVLLIGSVGTCLCLATFSLLFHTKAHEHLLIWPLMGYIAFFAFSQGAVIWVYISEVFPNAVRAKGQSLGSFTHWLMTAVLSWAFPLLSAHSAAVPFAFFSLMMAIQFFVVLFVFPETKGITLEDMQKKLGIA
jgi:hypothetical protein